MKNKSKFIVTLVLTLALSGCGMTFVYNNLSMLTPWLVDDYIDLNRDQKQQYQTYLKDIHAWHREYELPQYHRILAELNAHLETSELDANFLQSHLLQLRTRWQVLTQQATPAIIEMAKTLSDEQVAELADNLVKANNKRLEDAEELSDKTRNKEFISDVSDWMGRLSDEQKILLTHYIESSPRVTTLTVEAHQVFQQQMLDLLANRQSDNFAESFAALLTDPLNSEPGLRLTEFRIQRLERQIDLYVELWRGASDKQRRKVRNKLQGYLDDLDSLMSS